MYYPKYRIYLFSQKNKDDLIDKYIDKRINVNHTDFKNAGFSAKDFEKSLVIFDDVDSLSTDKDNNIKKVVYDIMTDVIETGRSLGVFCIVTSHLSANNTESKRILNGCTAYIFFKNSSTYGTTYTLKNYFGLSPKQIKKMFDLPDTRFICIFREIPQIIMTSKDLLFVNQL